MKKKEKEKYETQDEVVIKKGDYLVLRDMRCSLTRSVGIVKGGVVKKEDGEVSITTHLGFSLIVTRAGKKVVIRY